MKRFIFLATIIAMTGCADVYYRVGQNDKGGSVPIPALKKFSDTVGPHSIEITNNGIRFEVRDSNPNAPQQIVQIVDPRTGITQTTTTPIVAQSSPSANTIASGNAVNRMAHGLSNVLGTVITSWAGLEAAKGIAGTVVTQSNNAARVNNAQILSNTSIQNTKTAASVSKAALKAGFPP